MEASDSISIISRWRDVLSKIDVSLQSCGREKNSAKLIAVSKTHSFQAIKTLYEMGQRDFGENYVQELIEKAESAKLAGLSDIRWHFIGHLQTNKVKALLPYVYAVHGVGSLKLATELSRRVTHTLPIFLEVNLDGEESKSGVQISELRKLATEVSSLPNLKLLGLMGIPNPERPNGPRDAFHQLSTLEAGLQPLTSGELSMGMTSDFHEAILEGSTWIRVGTAIFGNRSPRK